VQTNVPPIRAQELDQGVHGYAGSETEAETMDEENVVRMLTSKVPGFCGIAFVGQWKQTPEAGSTSNTQFNIIYIIRN
jgi:hypothetical protein